MSKIVADLLARGWAFDAEGTLHPPSPSPELRWEVDPFGVRAQLPADPEDDWEWVPDWTEREAG